MSRVLFAKGVRGGIVGKMQRRLTELGFDTKGIDSKYGNDTRDAVNAFQRANGLAITGEVDVETFERLLGVAAPGVRDRSLQLTAAFEGHGFTLAQGNFDGAGITWGIIGFTLRHGEIKKIVLRINDENPALVRAAFRDKTDELLKVLDSSLSKQIAFADSISLGASKAELAEPWRSAFKRFGEMDEVQALQLELAEHDYFQPARRTAEEFGLKTELGLALAFDIHVQNGGLDAEARALIEGNLDDHPIANERDLRVIIANATADSTKPKHREDVRSRKLTVATGSGKVHGETFVLRNWGLDEFALE